MREAQLLGEEFEGGVAALAVCGRELEVSARALQRVDVAGARDEETFGRGLPAGDLEQPLAEGIEAFSRQRRDDQAVVHRRGALEVELVEDVEQARRLGQPDRQTGGDRRVAGLVVGVAEPRQVVQEDDRIGTLDLRPGAGDADYEAGDAAIAARLPAGLADSGRLLHLFNKLDLQRSASVHEGLVVSALTGEGLDALRTRLLDLAGWQAAPEGLFIARARHVHALQRARQHLELAAAHGERGNAALELFAEELRLAHDALGEVTGAFTSDDLLGAIFGRFCIGK